MKKNALIFSMFLYMATFCNAQTLNSMVNLEKYADSNMKLLSQTEDRIKVVFIGNSITEGWVENNADFFISNNYVGRGIGGQTSPQLLLRFRQDVVALNPLAVVINIGTNDIAENTGKYDSKFTLDNIKSMTEIAMANNIEVILSSVLPVGEYPWRKEIKNVPEKIDELNRSIKNYATTQGLLYIDYNTPMRDAKGALIESYGYDGVHPNDAGYRVMENIAKKALADIF